MGKKKTIIIFEKNKESLCFLKDFFKTHSNYHALFVNKSSLFAELLKKTSPDAVIVGIAELSEKMNFSDLKYPVVVMISSDMRKEIHTIIKLGIECYLHKPFYQQELEHKLQVSIQKSCFVENICRQKKDLETIVELTYLLSSTLDPKEVLYFVVKKIAEVIDVSRCSIISLPTDEKKYAYVISTFEDVKKAVIKLDLMKYPEIRKALASKNTVFIKDALKDPLMKDVRHIISPLGIRSIIVIPMIFRHEVIGTLFLRTSRIGHTFTDKEIRLCQAVAAAATNPMYNAFLYEKLEKEKVKLEKYATLDYFTGIYNVRYFYNRLDQEFSRAQRYHTSLSCIMFDLDHFKKVNDLYGHRVGDMVLREFAQCIKKHCRKSDVFARYGGEEFIMLLPQTPREGALSEADRIKKVLKGYRYKALGNKKGITVSMGVSFYPNKKIKAQDDIITLADSALFSAKHSGRDRICISE